MNFYFFRLVFWDFFVFHHVEKISAWKFSLAFCVCVTSVYMGGTVTILYRRKREIRFFFLHSSIAMPFSGSKRFRMHWKSSFIAALCAPDVVKLA